MERVQRVSGARAGHGQSVPVRIVGRKPVHVSPEQEREAALPDRNYGRIKVALLNMEGEKDPSLHEPISIEVLAARITDVFPNAETLVHDTQPELVRHGKIDTGGLAGMVCSFGNDASVPLLLGVSMPIYSYGYAKSLLLKLESGKPASPTSIVLGNAIPTYTDPSLLFRDFPSVTLVRGEGDEAILEIAGLVAMRRPLERIYEQKPDLKHYLIPYRGDITTGITGLGGSVKVETSRGCDYGDCTFCSRCERGGKDYRTVPEGKVVDTIRELVGKYNVHRFELTDEEAFANVDATRRLIGALQDANLPGIRFSASLRVDLLNGLEDAGLLEPIMKLGLDKVFLGVEGGSDEYLRLMAKGQTMAEARRAIGIAEERGINYEIGFIMFSWRMSLRMLQDNIAFVSEGENLLHISSIFNKLEVRAGTVDEKFIRPYNRSGKIAYDADSGFSVNDSAYVGVPFLDNDVGRIYGIVRRYEHAEENLYYAMKSYRRSGMASGIISDGIDRFYTGLVGLRLELMRAVSGLDPNADLDDIAARRKKLVESMCGFMDANRGGAGAAEMVRREARIFLAEEPERESSEPVHRGAMAVAVGSDGRVLLVRQRMEDVWSFPGGGIRSGEDPADALLRECGEEFGPRLEMRVLGNMGLYETDMHVDSTSLNTERLELHHFAAAVNPDSIDILGADHEIADILWADPEDILGSRIAVRANVMQVVEQMRRGAYGNLYRSVE